MSVIWGVNALNHDASITVMHNDDILFSGHSERYSRIKNDGLLNNAIIKEASEFGLPDQIVWFEKPLLKKSRQLYASQWSELTSVTPEKYLKSLGLNVKDIKYVPHHMSHAASGFFSSKYNDAAIIVVDAIGEWDTISVWHGKENKLDKIQSSTYPDSLGLLYSAVTQRCGLKPNEEEYILMGMAAYGNPIYYDDIKNDFIETCSAPNFKLKLNIHRGIKWWRPDISTEQDFTNLAASVQKITEEFMCGIAKWAVNKCETPNLVIMGGCALNCVANEKIAQIEGVDSVWIMPNPGDAGSSLGAILAHTHRHANWVSPYLGTNIEKSIDISSVVSALCNQDIIGLAHGRAEYGPRALGNRSILADPRGATVKDRVNDIKHRQRFRPFAPMILEDYAEKYFDMPVKASPYMQFTAKCKVPEEFPAICHIDNSSRVQTLNYSQNPVMYEILYEFYNKTGCPMLLNTSLNIKGQPLVNTWQDAMLFKEKYGIQVF